MTLHGKLRLWHDLEPLEWDEIKASWSLIDFDPYEQEV